VKTGAKLRAALFALGLLAGACTEDSSMDSDPSGPPREAEVTVSTTRMGRKLVRFEGKVLAVEMVHPATVGILARVKNVAETSGRPTCRVEAEEPSGAPLGVDSFHLRMTLKPRDRQRFYLNVPVTGQGAAFVTRATVDCS
jgi:hypothetical protein